MGCTWVYSYSVIEIKMSENSKFHLLFHLSHFVLQVNQSGQYTGTFTWNYNNFARYVNYITSDTKTKLGLFLRIDGCTSRSGISKRESGTQSLGSQCHSGSKISLLKAIYFIFRLCILMFECLDRTGFIHFCNYTLNLYLKFIRINKPLFVRVQWTVPYWTLNVSGVT